MKNLFSLFFLGFIAISMTSCKGKGGDANVNAADSTAVAVSSNDGASQTYHVVSSASKLHWEGYKPAVGTTHTGTVNISEGTLVVKSGIVESGSFTIDMSTITVTDQEGQSKANLEGHLKGTSPGKENDFFNIGMYPTGKFEITTVTALQGDAEGNTMVYGNLTLRDITKPVAFKANVNVANGSLTATTPLFKIDRTEYDIKVLSKKFFDNLQDGFVDDNFGIRVELRADAGKDL